LILNFHGSVGPKQHKISLVWPDDADLKKAVSPLRILQSKGLNTQGQSSQQRYEQKTLN
jgi:hypothetical protein